MRSVEERPSFDEIFNELSNDFSMKMKFLIALDRFCKDEATNVENNGNEKKLN